MYVSYWEDSAGWAEWYTKVKHLNVINSELKHYIHAYVHSFILYMCSLVEKAVEYFLDECASPQQLVQSFKPRIPPQ